MATFLAVELATLSSGISFLTRFPTFPLATFSIPYTLSLSLLPHVNTHVTRRATYCVLHTFVRLFGHAHFGHSNTAPVPLPLPLPCCRAHALSLQCCEKFIESCEQTQQSVAQAAIGLRKGTRHTFWLTESPFNIMPSTPFPPLPPASWQFVRALCITLSTEILRIRNAFACLARILWATTRQQQRQQQRQRQQN